MPGDPHGRQLVFEALGLIACKEPVIRIEQHVQAETLMETLTITQKIGMESER